MTQFIYMGRAWLRSGSTWEVGLDLDRERELWAGIDLVAYWVRSLDEERIVFDVFTNPSKGRRSNPAIRTAQSEVMSSEHRAPGPFICGREWI